MMLGQIQLWIISLMSTMFGIVQTAVSGAVAFSRRILVPDGAVTTPAVSWVNSSNMGFYLPNTFTIGVAIAGQIKIGFDGSGNDYQLWLSTDTVIAWATTNTFGNNVDLKLARDAANTLAQRNGANAQIKRLYNTYTDASNNEYLQLGWSSNICTITTVKTGTGTLRGLLIGGATTDLVGLHGATPTVQRAGAAQAAVATTAATNVVPFGFSEAQANAIVTLVNELRAAAVEKGSIKGSA